MQISRFQFKLTIIFLLVLIIPAIIAIFLTQYILDILTIDKRTGMDVDKKVVEFLQETSTIAYDIIDKAKEECKFTAQAISDEMQNTGNFNNIQRLIDDIVYPEHNLKVIILDGNNKALYSSSSDNESAIPSTLIEQLREQKITISEQDAEMVYGLAPIIRKGNFIASVIVYKQLEQELVRNIIDLRNLLGIYALREEMEKVVWIIITSFIIILAGLGTLIATLLARSITKPILDLVAGTREIANGNLDYRVKVKGKDEVATLVESFNLMTSQLKASRERLMMTERLSAWRDVARQIAHEIKNLLSPIQLSMYRLKKNLGSDRYNEIFEQSYTSITTEVENLKNMVTEFSNFARMPKPRTRPALINEIIKDAINLYNELPSNIEIKVNLADDVPRLMADSDQMRQVLHNLIGNAVDAMPDGGHLIISTHLESDEHVVLEVKDTGCGMTEEIRQRIFTPYFTTKEKGTGLGMAIVAQIVEEHGGTISVESYQGVGTIITIKLKTGVIEQNNEG